MGRTPWTYDIGVHGIFDADDNQIADINCSEEVANKIIRVCNMHDELIEILKMIREPMCPRSNMGKIIDTAIFESEGK